MRTKPILRRLVLSTLILVCASVAVADAAYWTDWTSAPAGGSTVTGTLFNGTVTLNVVYDGSYSFAQTSGGGTNYWTYPGPTSPYDSFNGPPNSDIIGLNLHGSKTITFDGAVTNPLFAWTSWQVNGADFGVPISILSYATGYWGSGTPTLRAGNMGFNAVGEETGVLQLMGTFTSITFTDSIDEYWHGFTIGVPDATPSGVPEPATILLLGLGLFGLVGAKRTRR